MSTRQPPLGVIGVFLLLLGAGLVLDTDRTWPGSALVMAGAACLLAEWRQLPRL